MPVSASDLLSDRQEAINRVHTVEKGYEILDRNPELTAILLRDHTTQKNIFWATESYAALGAGYQYNDPITVESVCGTNRNIVKPRAFKTIDQQRQRSREMAEVFTPSWICNKQNNLVDNAWFGREGVFNTEIDNIDGSHSWIINTEPVVFPKEKTWRDYVNENRLEITCGEAPYLVSRYDAVTGEPIPVERRIGLLDRKLRIVGENTSSSGEWLKAAQSAYQSIYGFEWQGDNLVLAREALLYTFIDYYRAKFGKYPQIKSLFYIAYIISWNIWQMDGLKGVIPNSCGERRIVEYDLFGETVTICQCEGCKSGDIKKHNGVYALIKDWSAPKAKQKIRFIDLIK
ncbi:MAG: restriction endonuclease subunit M [Muribaculaceae bacterium]|nr:restriction endonuclease subunit M [Muribaculaceae bacterium]